MKLDAALVCIGCGLHPSQLPVYVECAAGEGLSPAEYVRQNEGTLNVETGRFACDTCYIRMGQPSRPFPDRWIAP